MGYGLWAMNVFLRSFVVPLSATTIRDACVLEAEGARISKCGGKEDSNLVNVQKCSRSDEASIIGETRATVMATSYPCLLTMFLTLSQCKVKRVYNTLSIVRYTKKNSNILSSLRLEFENLRLRLKTTKYLNLPIL